jgi:hypothetical protein
MFNVIETSMLLSIFVLWDYRASACPEKPLLFRDGE